MRRFVAPIIDAVFVVACLVFIPSAVNALRNVARVTPSLYFHISIYATIFYPLACLAMLQKISTDQTLQDGMATLKRLLWRWYSWPLGIAFWTMMLFHSVIMTLGFHLGNMVRGNEGITGLNTIIDKWLLGIAIAIFVVTVAFIIIRLTGFRPKNFLRDIQPPRSLTWKILWSISLLILGPIYIFIAVALVLCTPFYLYCIIWWYSMDRASGCKEFVKPLPDTRPVRILSNAVLIIYTIVLSFFFEEMLDCIYSIHASGIFSTILAMALFYIPYRIFFGLYSGKDALGWITFGLGLIIVFMQTLSKFGVI